MPEGLQRFYTQERLSEHMAKTPEGFLICYDVPIARTGDYIYKSNEVPIKPNKDGLVTIQRGEDEVFSEATIKSFEGKPFTLNHPKDFVSPSNWAELAHGHLQNAHRGDGEKSDLLLGDLVVTTEPAIKLINAGLREISCGYDAKYEELGEGLGTQKNIIGNHIALVIKGRAGNRCAIMDSACECCGNCMCGKHKKTEDKEENLKMKTKDAKETRSFLARFFPKLNLTTVKDEDLEMAGEIPEGGGAAEAQQAAEEAKQAAIEAVNAAKQAAEAAKNAQVAPTPDDEPPMDPMEVINAKLDQLLEKIDMFLEMISSEEEPEPEPEPEEEPEPEPEWEGEKTGDAKWQDAIARAEILAPGIVATKPKASEMGKAIANVKRQALSQVMTKDSANAKLIAPLLGTGKVKDLEGKALDAVFAAASEIIRNINNSRMQKGGIQMKDLSSHNELADINARNRAFWAKEKK